MEQDIRDIRVENFTSGYVTVPKNDAERENSGYLMGFEHDNRYYCFHTADMIKDRVVYRDVTEE